MSVYRTWQVEEGPLWLECDQMDWGEMTTFCLELRSVRRTGAHVVIEIYGPGTDPIGTAGFAVDWIGENLLVRWLSRMGATEPEWKIIRGVRLICEKPGWWPTELEVGPVEGRRVDPTWGVNLSDTVVEMGWHETGHGAHRWKTDPDRSNLPLDTVFIRPPWPFLKMGYVQEENPGRLTMTRSFGLDISNQSQILSKISWDRESLLTVTAIVDGGREIHLAHDAPSAILTGRGFLTVGADLEGARLLDSVRISLVEHRERRVDGREISMALFWIMLRRPTPLDHAPTKNVTVRLASTVKPEPNHIPTVDRQVRQVPFDEEHPSTTPIGDPLEQGLPFGFFVRKEDLSELRHHALKGSGSPIFHRIQQLADRAIATELVDQNYYGTAHGGGIGHPKGFKGAGLRVFAPNVAISHLITGEEKYAVACRRWLLRAARSDALCGDHGGCVDRPQIGDQLCYWDLITEWHPKGSAGYMDAPFHVADAAFGLVVGYDMLYHCFSESEREEVENAFAENGVYLLYHPLMTRREFYVSMNQGVLFCLPLMMMTAFLRHRDVAYEDMHNWTREFLVEFGGKPWNEEGVCGEGPGYGIGTMLEYIEALPPLSACLGQTVTEVMPPSLRAVMAYAQHMRFTWWTDRPRFLALSDGGDGWIWGEILAFYSKYLNDHTAQYLWNETCAENPPISLSSLLYSSDPIVPRPPELPPAKVFLDQPMACLRTGWRHGDTLLVLNNIRKVTGHGHLDRASIILEYNGEQLLLDPGMITYEEPASNEYKRTFCHNAITFGQRDQLGGTDEYDTAITGSLILSGEQCPGIEGSLDWVIADATAVYPEATRLIRHVVFCRPSVFFLIDEVDARDLETIDINFTCLGTLSGHTGNYTSTATKNRLSIHTVATSMLNDTVKTWGTQWPEIPSHRLIHSTKYPTNSCIFLTALIPSALGATQPIVETFDVSGGPGVRVTLGAQQATVAVRSRGEIPDLGGIRTDGRIVVLNALSDQTRSSAMMDGSYLLTDRDGGLIRTKRSGLSGKLHIG